MLRVLKLDIQLWIEAEEVDIVGGQEELEPCEVGVRRVDRCVDVDDLGGRDDVCAILKQLQDGRVVDRK